MISPYKLFQLGRESLKSRPRGRKTPLQEWMEFIPAFFLLSGLGLIPFRLRYGIGEFAGHLAYLLDARHRRVAERNLAIAFPEWSDTRRKETARECFVNLGRMLAEVVEFQRLKPEELKKQVEWGNLHYLETAKKRGRGVLLLTAHFGNWELAAASFARLYEPVNVVVRPLDNRLLDKVVEYMRTLGGNRVIERRGGARDMLRALARGEIIGILADQNQLLSQGIFVDFFGVPASTTPGVASLALHSKADIIPAFLVREGFRRFRIIFYEPIVLVNSGDRKADIAAVTARCNLAIEKVIRQYPDQYFWLHRRWKTRPPGEASLYD